MPDSEVTAGLAELEDDGRGRRRRHRQRARGSVADVDAMYEKWATFEGTIKQNEVDLYLTMEDNLASLRSAAEEGDAAAATDRHGRAVRSLRRVPGRASVSRRCDRAPAPLAIAWRPWRSVLLASRSGVSGGRRHQRRRHRRAAERAGLHRRDARPVQGRP